MTDRDLADRLSRLTPAQRALLDQRIRERTRTPDRLTRIPRRQRLDRNRLTVDQERIWLIHQFDPTDPVYNVFFASRLRGDLDVDALRRAADAFVARHEMMRTTFELDGLSPVQVLHDTMAVPVRVVDLRDVPAERREQELRERVTHEVSQPFDLVHGPLLRLTLLRVDDREHVLVGTVDHLVWDRGSMGIFNHEFAELYSAFATGREPKLPEIAVHYADYAEWQPEWLREEVARKHLPFWRDHLAGADLVLELPTDRPRPPVQTFRGARHQFGLTPRLTQQIRDLAKREDVTVNVALLTAWQLMLHRLTGKRDIVVGTTSSTRSRPETEPMLGYFLTMLPLRITIEPGMTVREAMRASRATMMAALNYHDIPFGTLLDELDIERDPSRTPVYQTSFILVDFLHEDPPPMAGLEIEELMFDNHTAKDDISLGFFDDPALADHFVGLFEYNTDLFDPSTVERMTRQLERVLEQMIADPGRPVAGLELMSPDEVHTVLVEWNDTAREREPGECLEDLVRRQAAATPDAVAVRCGPDSLTYAQLVDRSARLATYLRERGIGTEDVVGVCLERSCDLLVGLLGVVTAGAAYLPLDPRYPRQRLADVVTDAGATLVLTQAALLDALDACPGDRVCMDADGAAIAARPPSTMRPALGDDRLAYVIYTSGSTGRPKGVEVTHANLVNLLRDIVERIALRPGDVLAAVTSVSFDIAGLELYAPLVAGAQVLVARREDAQDGRALAALLADGGATVMQATPATWQLLVEAGWRNDAGMRVLVGGEALPPSLAERLVTPEGVTWNVYGPTETTIWSTAHRIDDGHAQVSIGRPLANTKVYVLDERLAPVPVGVPGDLYLAGAGVARGYRGRPGLTAERFVPDHLSGVPGARMYATGDRVRLRADGTLLFLGRDDGQIKLRGFRIELGEIEHRLAQHEQVRQAAALVREDRPGDRRLVGYVETDEQLSADELRAHLRAHLPEYMVPSAIVAVPRFPLTTSGKIDRRALPAPSAQRGTENYVAPRDRVELEITRIWEDVLGVRPIGIRDQFFDLGGHSLLVLRLMAEIEQRFDRHLPMAAIFQGATVEQFARMVRDGYQPASDVQLVRLAAGGTGTPVFFAHPAGSEVVCYRPFVGLLRPADRPLYALASPPPVDGRLPFDQFEDRAAAYAALIRAAQPEGPYVLAGWCYGGSNAYAVARELERTGASVSLVLIDSHAPDPDDDGDEPDRAAIVEAVAANLQWDYGDNLLPVDDLRAMTDQEHLDYLLRIAWSANYLPADAGHEQMTEVLSLWLANLRLLWRYRPERFAGHLTLVRATDEEYDPAPSWRSLAQGRFDVREVDGNHYTIMRQPRIKAVAAVLNEVLDSVDAGLAEGTHERA